MRARFIFPLLALVACPKPPPELLVIPYCDLPMANCPAVPAEMDIADLEDQVWCCDKVGDGGCVEADLLTDCDALNQYAVYCEHGQSAPLTNPQGGEFECFGELQPPEVDP
jgi:hypothetical protein